jgi:hypothetical protein
MGHFEEIRVCRHGEGKDVPNQGLKPACLRSYTASPSTTGTDNFVDSTVQIALNCIRWRLKKLEQVCSIPGIETLGRIVTMYIIRIMVLQYGGQWFYSCPPRLFSMYR